MIIKAHLLQQAMLDKSYLRRNDLLLALSSRFTDSQDLSAIALAGLLGHKIVIVELDMIYHTPILTAMQNVVIGLDRLINDFELEDADSLSKSIHILRQVQFFMVQTFNQNPASFEKVKLLTMASTQTLTRSIIESIVERLKEVTLKSRNHRNMLNNLVVFIKQSFSKSYPALPEFPWQAGWRLKKLIGGMGISHRLKLLVNHIPGLLQLSQFHRSLDGTMIETCVFKKESKQRQVLLVSVGLLGFEHQYIEQSLAMFAMLLPYHVVFINHRNVCQHTARKSFSLNTMVDDIESVHHYYQERDHQVYLYGICAGGTLMATLAQRLQAQCLPYKLVIDRASQTLSSLLSEDSYLRFTELVASRSLLSGQTPTLAQHIYQRFLSKMIGPLISLFAPSSLLEFDLVALVRKLQPSNVLILEGKSKKKGPDRRRAEQDYLISDKCALRYAFKASRSLQRAALSTMRSHALNVCCRLPQEHVWHQLFKGLFSGLHEMLRIIDSEKCTSLDNAAPGTKYVRNLHYLSPARLKPRYYQSMQPFLLSFFKPQPCIDESKLQMLATLDMASITDGLEQILPCKALIELAKHLQHLFGLMAHHANCIVPLSGRLPVLEEPGATSHFHSAIETLVNRLVYGCSTSYSEELSESITEEDTGSLYQF